LEPEGERLAQARDRLVAGRTAALTARQVAAGGDHARPIPTQCHRAAHDVIVAPRGARRNDQSVGASSVASRASRSAASTDVPVHCATTWPLRSTRNAAGTALTRYRSQVGVFSEST